MANTFKVSRGAVCIMACVCLLSAAQTLLSLGPFPGTGHGIISLHWPLCLVFGVLEVLLAGCLVLLLGKRPEQALKASRVIAGIVIAVAVFNFLIVSEMYKEHHDATMLGWAVGTAVRRVVIPVLVLFLFAKAGPTSEVPISGQERRTE